MNYPSINRTIKEYRRALHWAPFLMYIKDITYNLRNDTKTTLYVDNKSLTYSGKSLVEVEKKTGFSMTVANNWFNSIRLGLNLNKSGSMLFIMKKMKVDSTTFFNSVFSRSLHQHVPVE